MLQVTNTFTVEDMRRFDLREMLGAFMRAIGAWRTLPPAVDPPILAALPAGQNVRFRG